jgi:hypothetical protein
MNQQHLWFVVCNKEQKIECTLLTPDSDEAAQPVK